MDVSSYKKEYQKLNLNQVYDYITFDIEPSGLSNKQRKNFSVKCKQFYIGDNGKMLYKKKVKDESGQDKLISVEVLRDDDEQLKAIKFVHQGSDNSIESIALSSHRGSTATIELISKRFYWPNYTGDVKKFVHNCKDCQNVNPQKIKIYPELQPVPVPKKPMSQIGVDIIHIPESGGMKYIVVAIDYFTKWTEAKALPSKEATETARFLFEYIVCRHGCPDIQINDQGREFVNSVADEYHRLTGTQQRMTAAYHPQANGMVERENRSIKNYLLKVLQSNTDTWPQILDGVLFAQRTSRHSCTGFSPFFLLYNREPNLPIDVVMKDCEEESIIDEESITNEDNWIDPSQFEAQY